MDAITLISGDARANFNLRLTKLWRREPVLVTTLSGLKPTGRLSNYLICDRSGRWTIVDLPTDAMVILRRCLAHAEKHLLPTENRYAYLTLDSGEVTAGQTQRNPGWHFDGLQGDEVPVKQPGDFHYTWSDTLGTEFTTETVNLDDIDLSRHNVFRALEERGRPPFVTFPDGALVLFGPYHAHRSVPAKTATRRHFFRLTFTHVPVTSRRMTINPRAIYDYPAHSTSGEINPGLK